MKSYLRDTKAQLPKKMKKDKFIKQETQSLYL